MLNVEVRGRGPELVMLHGWGMHSAVWSDWADELAAYFRVYLVDLPGHGSSTLVRSTLTDWSAAVRAVVPDNAWWLGWSLGGLVALHAARTNPAGIRGLALVASTPRFVASADWTCAVDAQVFEQFARQLDTDLERTLTRFLALQLRGSRASTATLRRLRQLLQQRPLAQKQALVAGLDFLQGTDLRPALAAVQLPVHWLFGERDTLVPVRLAEQVSGHKAIIAGAGHAPFLSHAQACTAQLRAWLLRQGGVYAAG
jgi:pimeloyl-[acyl-carrier protein] methyl ester esterase